MFLQSEDGVGNNGAPDSNWFLSLSVGAFASLSSLGFSITRPSSVFLTFYNFSGLTKSMQIAIFLLRFATWSKQGRQFILKKDEGKLQLEIKVGALVQLTLFVLSQMKTRKEPKHRHMALQITKFTHISILTSRHSYFEQN